MKNIFRLTCLLLCGFTAVSHAQPPAVKSVAKSVVTLTTFKADGTVNASAHGVMIGADGVVVSLWKPFVGAKSAVIVDGSGNKMPVEAIDGINELYDVCKFQVSPSKNHAVCSKVPAKQGDKVWIVGYSTQQPEYKQCPVQKTETFMENYAYYLLSSDLSENLVGCPVVNAKGEVLGILQSSKSTADNHATDARFIMGLHSSDLPVTDPVYMQTGIRGSLPNDKDKALLTLLMAQQQKDSLTYIQYVNDFISRFPTDVTGYAAQARAYVDAGQFDKASAEMETAVKQVKAKDEAHAEYAKLIYQKLIYNPDTLYRLWTFDKALEEAKAAYALNPQPAYKHQEAQVIYAKGDYQQAYDMFMELTKTPLRNGELYYEAAQCKAQLGTPQKDVLALLDSAVAACPQPYDNLAAPYFYARAMAYDRMGEHRKALIDYNMCDTLQGGRASHEFYYARYRCELQMHQYQIALRDITHAILLNPQEPTYLAEMASLLLRVNRAGDALKIAKRCTELAPDYPDGFLLLGLAQVQLKDKEAGLQNLERARSLGDTRAQSLIDKYK